MIQQINNFPIKLKALRALNSLNQVELSAKAGIHKNLIIDYERGRAIPSQEQLKKIELALNIEFNEATEEAFARLAPELGGEVEHAA